MEKGKILIFRTSVVTRKDIEQIEILFAQYSCIHKWSVDFEDGEKVLRVESQSITATTIIETLRTIGIIASELEESNGFEFIGKLGRKII